MVSNGMRLPLLVLAGIVAPLSCALAEEGNAALTCPMSNGSTVYFVRHYKVPGLLLADNFEFYDNSGKITKDFRGSETDDKYRYWWGMLDFNGKKTQYQYELDRFSLDIVATFQSTFEPEVTRLTGKCSQANFEQIKATIAELKARHEKEAADREQARKRKQELEEQERLSRRKI